jgi:hypothetical protein
MVLLTIAHSLALLELAQHNAPGEATHLLEQLATSRKPVSAVSVPQLVSVVDIA